MREGFKPYTRGDKKGSHSETVKINRAEQVRQYDETRYPIDIIKFSNGNNHSIHPTQKPVALFEYLIKTYTNENELVLDNCSGSGTTAIACMNTNRRFICIERDETYHRKSIERINNHEPLFHLGAT
jgi:site-specific DNA-methyltransferase (adenine-specific)